MLYQGILQKIAKKEEDGEGDVDPTPKRTPLGSLSGPSALSTSSRPTGIFCFPSTSHFPQAAVPNNNNKEILILILISWSMRIGME